MKKIQKKCLMRCCIHHIIFSIFLAWNPCFTSYIQHSCPYSYQTHNLSLWARVSIGIWEKGRGKGREKCSKQGLITWREFSARLAELKLFHDWLIILHGKFLAPGWNLSTAEPRELFRFFGKLFLSIIWFVRARLWLHLKVLKIVQTKIKPLKGDFQSSHEAPHSSLRVMHEHFHPITMINSSFN